MAEISFCRELVAEPIEDLTFAAETFIENTNHNHRYADRHYKSIQRLTIQAYLAFAKPHHTTEVKGQ